MNKSEGGNEHKATKKQTAALFRIRSGPEAETSSFVATIDACAAPTFLQKAFQPFRSELVLFPLGHHSTLPRPSISVPKSTL